MYFLLEMLHLFFPREDTVNGRLRASHFHSGVCCRSTLSGNLAQEVEATATRSPIAYDACRTRAKTHKIKVNCIVTEA